MNIKRIQRIQQRTTYEAKDLLSTKLFSTYKHSYTVGDMITLFGFMILYRLARLSLNKVETI